VDVAVVALEVDALVVVGAALELVDEVKELGADELAVMLE